MGLRNGEKSENDQQKTRTATATLSFIYCSFVSVVLWIYHWTLHSHSSKLNGTLRWSAETMTKNEMPSRQRIRQRRCERESATQVKHDMTCLFLSLRLWMCDSFLFAWWQRCNKKLNRNHHHQIGLAHSVHSPKIAHDSVGVRVCICLFLYRFVYLFAHLPIGVLASVPEINFFGAVATLCQCICVWVKNCNLYYFTFNVRNRRHIQTK